MKLGKHRHGALGALAFVAAGACAQSAAPAGASIAAGKALHAEKACVACHQQRTGQGEHAFYTRPERKVQSREKLLAQVQACNAQINLGLFPEDEQDIAAYLNSEHYRFK